MLLKKKISRYDYVYSKIYRIIFYSDNWDITREYVNDKLHLLTQITGPFHELISVKSYKINGEENGVRSVDGKFLLYNLNGEMHGPGITDRDPNINYYFIGIIR